MTHGETPSYISRMIINKQRRTYNNKERHEVEGGGIATSSISK